MNQDKCQLNRYIIFFATSSPGTAIAKVRSYVGTCVAGGPVE